MELIDLSTLNPPEIAIVAVIGLVLMFVGYRIKKVAFFLMWFILGFYGVLILLPHVGPLLPAEIMDSDLYRALLPLGGGLLLALLGFSIEKFCIGAACFALVMLITVHYFGTAIQTLAIGGVVGVLAAAAGVMLMKPATIIATAAIGSYAVLIALIVLLPDLNQYQYAFLPALIVATAIGAITQFLTTKRVK